MQKKQYLCGRKQYQIIANMKKIFSFFAFTAIVFSFAACGGNNPEVKAFRFKISKAATYVTAVVTPAKSTAPFFIDVVRVSEVETEGLEKYARERLAKRPFDDWLFDCILVGPDAFFWTGIGPDSKYLIYAFYVEKASDGSASIVSNIVSEEFSTPTKYTLNGEFSVDKNKKVHFCSSDIKSYRGTEYLCDYNNHQYSYYGTYDSPESNSLFTWETTQDPLLTGSFDQLTADEWYYLFKLRDKANERFTLCTLTEMGTHHGLLILPDDWKTPDNIELKMPSDLKLEWNEDYEKYINMTPNFDGYSLNVFDENTWRDLQLAGAVFLPATGNDGENMNQSGWCWSATEAGNNEALTFGFSQRELDLYYLKHAFVSKSKHYAIRPVRRI